MATSTPVTVSATTDCTVVSDLSVAGAVAVNLPAGVDGQMFFLLDGKQDAASNNITVTPNGAETINGAATLVMDHNGQGLWIQYKSSTSNWYVLANIVVPGTITPADIVGVIPANKGGTGIANNASSTLTISGAYATTLTVSGATGVTLPTTGTLATLAGSETLSNKTIASPTVTGELLLQNPSGSQPTLALSEDPDNGTNKVVLQAAASMASNYTITMPDAVPASNGYALTATTGGVASWSPVVTNPMTTRGDMIRATTGGTPERFAAVTDNQVVAGDGTDVVSKQIDDPAFFAAGAYATGSAAGTLPPVTSMGDDLATQLGLKQYITGVTYNASTQITFSSTPAGWSLTHAYFIPYKVQDGSWRCRVNINASWTSTATPSVSINLEALSSTQPAYASAATTAAYSYGFITRSGSQASTIEWRYGAAQTGGTWSADFVLNAKPTWAY